jgi:four helix bundle protein
MSREKPWDLRERTFNFARDVLHLCTQLQSGAEIGTIKRQLVRSATSVGANYRAARRARSRRDFVAKLSIVEEEADECLYWLKLLELTRSIPLEVTRPLKDEANEILSIVVTSKKTARRKGL